MPRGKASSLSPSVAAIFGGLVGAGLMGGVAYTHWGNISFGALAGAVLVGALSFGVATGTMSPVTLCAVLLALFFAMIGPGCDDYGGTTVIPGATFGALLGWLFFGRRRAIQPRTAADSAPPRH
ncbi:hypothetical protein [Aquisphaera insulae]|uniref:hypothetical protein n=1 Tax=Aquisphaera insulae TaxID=2712864 RepID=UPI0013EC1716|nr:hypothetical protein [Aquisphaera insulae]